MIRTEVICASASHIWGMFFLTGLRDWTALCINSASLDFDGEAGKE